MAALCTDAGCTSWERGGELGTEQQSCRLANPTLAIRIV